jgi:hypothetical protein
MQMNSPPHIFLFLWFALAFCLESRAVQAQIIPPNYDFSFEQLEVFWPEQSLEQMIARHGAFETLQEQGGHRLVRFSVEQLRYRFGVFVELRDDTVLGFFASLPSYFLHDLFHQGLINRFGPQDQFRHVDSTSVYRWRDARGYALTYTGACTITCFPVYIAGTTDSTILIQSFLGDLRPLSPIY